jgi:hypothetical protein
MLGIKIMYYIPIQVVKIIQQNYNILLKLISQLKIKILIQCNVTIAPTFKRPSQLDTCET